MDFLLSMFGLAQPADNLRIIIARHGERADFTLGPGWIRDLRMNGGYHPQISYLPDRQNFHEWNYDSPITISGERQGAVLGKRLLQLGLPIDYCYSSPAYRSVQTANMILKSQGRQAVPINIEPGLYECRVWNNQKPMALIHPKQLAKDGRFHINSKYSPICNYIDPYEDERLYYARCQDLIHKIVQRHKNQGGTILISGHGCSIEALTRGLRGANCQHVPTQYLRSQSSRVKYCNFAVLERDAYTGKWTVRCPGSGQTADTVGLTTKGTIPLHCIGDSRRLKHTEAFILRTLINSIYPHQ